MNNSLSLCLFTYWIMDTVGAQNLVRLVIQKSDCGCFVQWSWAHGQYVVEFKKPIMMGPFRILCMVFLLPTCTLVSGHGNMVLPFAWWDKDQIGWAYDKDDGKLTHIGCGVLDLPEDTEFDAQASGSDEKDCMQYWFSNQVFIPGNATIPPEMSQPEVTCSGYFPPEEGRGKEENPWFAPGSAAVFGPCGTLGAMPNGCNNDGKGSFGDCCVDACGSFALGDNTENYEWPDMPITTWYAGGYQEVAWYVSANHGGGYSYRLCKMPEGGIGELTEECFQQTPLDFVGDEQWINYEIDRVNGHRTEVKARQTTVGTFPEGSMWRANPVLPYNEPGGSHDYGHGHIIDTVKVPADLEPGEYVVSFR